MDMSNTNEIAVSVYCLAYNHEKYIKQALEGFIKQKTNFKYEVIVHDDASTDGTADIIREYEQLYPDIIKGIYQKENQYSKRVRIVQKYIYPVLKGKYIAVCEGDDYWTDSNKLQLQYDALEMYKDCSLCVSSVECCNEDGSYNRRTIPGLMYNLIGNGDRKLSSEDLSVIFWEYGGYPFQTSSYMYRRESVFPTDFEYKDFFIRDRGLLREFFLHGNFYYIDHPLSVWRIGSANSWHERMQKASVETRVNTLVENFNIEYYTNLCSSGKYQNAILIGLFDLVYSIAALDQIKAQEMYEKILELTSEDDLIRTFDRCTVPQKRAMIKKKYQKFKNNPKVIRFEYRINNRISAIKRVGILLYSKVISLVSNR